VKGVQSTLYDRWSINALLSKLSKMITSQITSCTALATEITTVGIKMQVKPHSSKPHLGVLHFAGF